ncbi:S26 family signal peptidase [Streptomyces marokkonensis]|uniref:S26 family signal peptidase n=1 Tax=Streptomyces marokkonensis TaxID=324855 RepID=A0ABW6Q9Y0_9ACTN|nr:S26 family signal peptidase [Streptomyces marokkonensis]
MKNAVPMVLGAVSSAVLLTTLARSRYLVVTVEGASMAPTLLHGERVLVRRVRAARIRTGRIVVTERPTGGRWDRMRLPPRLIKRVAAAPGEPLPRAGAPALRDLPEDRVPQGRVVLVGDNPAESLDSRFCGYVRTDQVFGVVVRVLPGPARDDGREPTAPLPRPAGQGPSRKDGTRWRT